MYKKIIFWQRNISLHQSAFLKSLSKHTGIKVTLVVEDLMNERRVKMGWEEPSYAYTEVKIAPKEEYEYEAFIEKNIGRGEVHIISGLVHNKFSSLIFQKLSTTDNKVGVLTESYKDDDLYYYLRLFRAFFHSLKFRKNISFFLTIGNASANQLKILGFSKAKIVPFAYFVDDKKNRDEEKVINSIQESELTFNIIYVGSLVKWKGVYYLLRSLEQIKHLNFKLTIIGDGPLKVSLLNDADKFGISSKIEWKNNLNNSVVKEHIAHSDLLVLPSTYDGWGAVISEALMVGTPVLCSDKCGAAILVQESGYGKVFCSENTEQLKRLLSDFILNGKIDEAQRLKIREWSEESISPQVAVKYFLKVLDFVNGVPGPKPVAPWFKEHRIENVSC